MIRKILSSRSWSQTTRSEPLTPRSRLQRADQHAEAGRVEELDVREVDDQIVVPASTSEMIFSRSAGAV